MPNEIISITAPLIDATGVIHTLFAPLMFVNEIVAPLVAPAVFTEGIYEYTRVSGFTVIGVASISVDLAVTVVDTTLSPPLIVPIMVSVWVDDVNAILFPPKIC